MLKTFFLLLISCSISVYAQDILKLKDVQPKKDFDNILVQKLNDDDRQSSFIIWVKKEVKLHKHEWHTENLYVIEGKGEMQIGDEKFVIQKGDYFNIPKDTPHGLIVLSGKPVKVLSIQSPQFLGQDRIFINEE